MKLAAVFCITFSEQNKEINVKVKMSFSKIPMKNPGRYFETFVKIVEPIGGQTQNTAFCSQRLVEQNLNIL